MTPGPLSSLGEVADRAWPVLAFLALVQVVADLCADAGLFDVSAHLAARAARGRVLALFGLFVLLAVGATWVLSIDTTAVLLTPIALRLAAELGVEALPFAFASVWLANTASLLLPVSNLTNLLAQERLDLAAGTLVARTWAPQLVVLVVVIGVLLVRHRRALAGRFLVPVALPRHDRVLVAVSALVVLAFGAVVVLGAPAWAAALGAVVVLVAVFALRRPAVVRPGRLVRMLPYPVLGFAIALFVVLGLTDGVAGRLLGSVTGRGHSLLALLRLGAVSTGLANLVDNLPAYLLAESVAHDTPRLLSVLVGVNAGPLLLLWGSLANLLWLRACRLHGLQIGGRRFFAEGLLVAPVAVVAGVLAVWVSV